MSAQPDILGAGPERAAPPSPAVPEPEFEVLGARPMRHAAAPTLILDLQISEPSGRQVYMIGLSIQLMLEPARRGYDGETRQRLAEMSRGFGGGKTEVVAYDENSRGHHENKLKNPATSREAF